jgi:HEAT repeat protein
MIARILLCSLLASPALALLPAHPTQEPAKGEEKPDKRPEIAELLTRLSEHADKRGAEDTLAIEVIDKLLQEFPESGPKDRAAIVKGLDKCFSEKRQESEEGVRDNKLYIASATALGAMGPESVKVLIGWIDNKTHRADMQLQRALILALGKTKDPSATKPLVDLLPHNQASMQSAAAEALGAYADAKQEVRKEIFESVLKVLTALKNAVDTDANDIISRERYDAISAAMITTLQRLARHEERDPAEWQRWWNKNKKENWDAPTGG